MERPPSGDVPLFSTRSLEGEYVAWNHVWTRDYGAGVNLLEIIVDNYGVVHAEDVGATVAYVRTYLGVDTTLPAYLFNLWQRINSVSATGKYFLGFERVTSRQFEVWRDGVQIFNRDTQLDEPTVNSVVYASISPNGKFIAVIITKAITFSDQIMMLYEGV